MILEGSPVAAIWVIMAYPPGSLLTFAPRNDRSTGQSATSRFTAIRCTAMVILLGINDSRKIFFYKTAFDRN